MRKKRWHCNRVRLQKSIRIFVASLMLLAANVLAVSVAASDPSIDTVSVATWNIRWFNQDGFAPGESLEGIRTPADLQALQRYAKILDADIIGLQEIGEIATLDPLFPRSQYNTLIAAQKNRHQNVALALKNHLRYKIHREGQQLAQFGGRPALDVSVEVSKNHWVRLLVVHLKAGCSSNTQQKRRNRRAQCATLYQELGWLRSWVSARQREKHAFILLGDFNRQLAQTHDLGWAYLTRSAPSNGAPFALQRLAHNKKNGACHVRLWNRNGQRWNRGLSRFPEPIDHILVGGGKPIQGEAELFPYKKSDVGRYNLSDHCPLRARVTVPQ